MFNLLFFLFRPVSQQGGALPTTPPVQRCMPGNPWRGWRIFSLVSSRDPWLSRARPSTTSPTRPSTVGLIKKMVTSCVFFRGKIFLLSHFIPKYAYHSGPYLNKKPRWIPSPAIQASQPPPACPYFPVRGSELTCFTVHVCQQWQEVSSFVVHGICELCDWDDR